MNRNLYFVVMLLSAISCSVSANQDSGALMVSKPMAIVSSKQMNVSQQANQASVDKITVTNRAVKLAIADKLAEPKSIVTTAVVHKVASPKSSKKAPAVSKAKSQQVAKKTRVKHAVVKHQLVMVAKHQAPKQVKKAAVKHRSSAAQNTVVVDSGTRASRPEKSFNNSGLIANNPPLAEKISRFIKKVDNDKYKLQGGALAILYKGQVVYKTTFGYQKGNHGAITTNTLFPLASVSKPVSATAIALMVDRHMVDLDQEIRLPYLKNSVNLKHILSHTTGYKFSGNLQIEQGLSRPKILDELKQQPVFCNPGACYRYSNITYSLVDDALNTRNLNLDYAINNLKSVLKTDQIQIAPANSGREIAYPHAIIKNKKGASILRSLPFPPHYPRTVPASAGIFASIDGMIELFKLSFGYRPDLISTHTLNKFHTPYVVNKEMHRCDAGWPCSRSKVEAYYGLGWRILKAKEYPGKNLIFHGGYISGAVSFIGFIPSEDIGIVILVNQNSSFAIDKGMVFWGEFLNNLHQSKII